MSARVYSDASVLILKWSSGLKWINMGILIKKIWSLSKACVSTSSHCSNPCFFSFTLPLKSFIRDLAILK